MKEFGCKHCGSTKGLSGELLAVLELVRCNFKAPVIVTSGKRCEEHNHKVGGSKKSKHLEGIAADIVVDGIKPRVVFGYLVTVFPNSYGIGLYDGHVHIDVRKNKARWGDA